jgi:AcrR family transcriptional regulator
MEYVSDNGVGDLSLRKLAAAIGTSHRMLIYHFGSKEGLLIEIIRNVEAQQRDQLAAFDVDPAVSENEAMRRMWKHLSDPSMWPNERLFYEMYGQALQARPHTVDFLAGIVESWLEPAAAMRRRQGVPESVVLAQARLDVALARGLILDLLATHDVAGTDAAVEQATAIFEAWRASLPVDDTVAARTVTRTLETEVAADAVFAVMSEPKLLPRWAPAFADSVSGDAASGWRITKDGSTFPVRIPVSSEARTVDFLREIAPGREAGAYLRAQPRPGGGAVVSMTAPIPPDADASGVATTLDEELRTLVRLAATR